MAGKRNSKGKPVAVVIGATSKWQADGRNTKLAHGKAVDDSDLPVGIRWGIGGAIAQKFAKRGLLHRADDPHARPTPRASRRRSASRAATA